MAESGCMPIRHLTIAALLAGVLDAPSLARSATQQSFDMEVPAPPAPVTIEGREWLIYELHLTNFGHAPLQLTRLEVLEAGDEVLQSHAQHELDERTAIAGASRADVRPVLPGERAIVFLEVALSGKAPRLIRHRLRFTSEPGREASQVIGGEVDVGAKPRLALGPPLRGGPWAAVYAWEWPRGHRRVFYTLEGRARLPGRLAIDWVRRDAHGNSARGDADIVKNSLGYGAEVLAVADARVAAVRDGIPESERVSANPQHSLDEAAGNYISLDLGDGRFAFYEHLRPGSIRVARGDRVRRGQVIAALGFTGDSTEPHLHFHVADSPSPLLGEGLPFEFQMRGRRERPAPNTIVTFD